MMEGKGQGMEVLGAEGGNVRRWKAGKQRTHAALITNDCSADKQVIGKAKHNVRFDQIRTHQRRQRKRVHIELPSGT